MNIRPFTELFPEKHHAEILSFLHPQELEKYAVPQPVMDEPFLKNSAKNELDKSWKRLLDNLMVILANNPNINDAKDEKLSLTSSPKEVYLQLRSKHLIFLFETLCLQLKKREQKDVDQNPALLCDCLMHAFIEPANEKIDASILKKISDFKIFCFYGLLNNRLFGLLDEMLDQGFTLFCEESRWYAMVFAAIQSKIPASTLGKLINRGKDQGKFKNLEAETLTQQVLAHLGYTQAPGGRSLPQAEKFYTTPLLLALIRNCDDDTITVLMNALPDEVIPTIDALKLIESGVGVWPYIGKFICEMYFVTGLLALYGTGGTIHLPGLSHALSVAHQSIQTGVKVSPGEYAGPSQATQAKIKILRLLDRFEKKAEVPMSSQDKALILNELKKDIQQAKTPAECHKLYDLHAQACYISNNYWKKMDAVLCYLWSTASTYTQTKKDFINLLRDRVYEIVMQTQFRNSFIRPFQYLEACRAALDHPIFSAEHDKQGVDIASKKKLQERISSLEKTLDVGVDQRRI